MFDIGFTEMLLIGVVALVVIGPEKLPGVARTAGKYFSRLKRFMSNVKADVESELRADELREILAKQQEELNSLKNVVRDAGKNMDSALKDVSDITSGEGLHKTGAVDNVADPPGVETSVSGADPALSAVSKDQSK